MKVFVSLTCFMSLVLMLQAPAILASRTQTSRLLLAKSAYGGPCQSASDCAAPRATCPNNVCTGYVSNTDPCTTNTDCIEMTSTCTVGKCTAKGSVADKGDCTAASDCSVENSSCISDKCSSPGAIGDGDTCVTGSDCHTNGATCTNQKCTAPGSVADGGACTAQTDCAASLTCGVKSKKCYGPNGSDSIASPSPSTPSSTPTSSTPGVVTVTFSVSLEKFSVATFQAQQQSDFKSAVLSKATGATACSISNMHDGSLLLDSSVTFPKTDSNANTNAASFRNALTTNSSSVFPSDTYGAVKVGSTQTSGHQGLVLSSVVFFVALIIIGIAQ